MSNSSASRRAIDLQDAVHSLAGPARVELQKLLGQDAIREAQEGVRKSRDPYGNEWAPITSRNGQPLRKTGNNIQRGWTAGGETPDKFVFGSRFKYLATHQYGAVIKPKPGNLRGRLRFRMHGKFVSARQVTIPRRQLVPEMDTGGLGDKWQRSFAVVVKNYLRKKLFKKGWW